ncbi:GNAT family N-acetyltransferase [Aliiroseovarius sp. F47248L]|uniref:GNAT family N-acetyltransferase n=1 Tax=Aliiroseovarius sp. F47248L TaxID=2926420 RepID=UPI001FF41002|nr:GNAT family N-acetyltransferase [Aliiroseovarius sp. F47248L]MCK0140191.1 GNAT family N-acetyltransferase [Aliiroseovarius sp. F47248L]
MKSLEFATDLLVQAGQTNVAHYDDRIVQTTPDEPNFWFGNRVIFCEPPTDANALIEQFSADVPSAHHICIGWDIPNLPRDSVAKVFDGSGLRIEQSDTLALCGDLNRAQTPDGLTIRPLTSAKDWAQSAAISKVDLIKDGAPVRGMDNYLRQKTLSRRTQISNGLGQWFGAFDDDRLVGDMGIFHDDKLIRYQSVQTHENYRRRGVCSALLCASLDWARARASKALPVIVAHSDSDAGRLYRRAGFELAETTMSVYRPPH